MEPKDIIGPAVSGFFAFISWWQSRRTHRDRMLIEKEKLKRDEEWRREEKDERAAEREAEAREKRIAEVIRRWDAQVTIPSGLDRFRLAGALTLRSDEELRGAAERLVSMRHDHPFGGYVDFFDRINALEALKEWEEFSQKKPSADLAVFLNAVRARHGLSPAVQRVRRK